MDLKIKKAGYISYDSHPSRSQVFEKAQFFINDRFFVLLFFILFTRLVSETINTFFWDKANQLWAMAMIGFICFLLFPILVIITKRDTNIVHVYFPIILFLFYMMGRVQYGTTYSLKCAISEVIIWFSFIFTVEVCNRNERIEKIFKKVVIAITKIIVIICFFQLVHYIIKAQQFNPFAIMEARPVKGIYVHQSICLIMLFPFAYVFLKDRSYLWFFLILLVSLFTGSRSTFLGLFLLSFIVVYLPTYGSHFYLWFLCALQDTL